MICNGRRRFETVNLYEYELYKQKNDDIRPQPTEIGYTEFPQLTRDLHRRTQPHYGIPTQRERDNRHGKTQVSD